MARNKDFFVNSTSKRDKSFFVKEDTTPNVLQKQNITKDFKTLDIGDFVNTVKNSPEAKKAQLTAQASDIEKRIKQKEQEYNRANNYSNWDEKMKAKTNIGNELNSLRTQLDNTRTQIDEIAGNSNDKLLTPEQVEEYNKNAPISQKIDKAIKQDIPRTAEKVGRTAMDLLGSGLVGATNAVEGMADVAVGNVGALASGVTSGFGLAPNSLSEKIKNGAEDFVRFNFSGEELLEEKKNEGAGAYEPKILGVKVRDALNTISNMVTSATFGGVPGFIASAAGQNIEQALNDNQSLNRAVVYGDIAGAVEGLTEKMFDAVNLLGGGKFDKFIPKGAIGKLIGGSAGEAIEEVVSEGINPFLKYLTYEKGTYDMPSLVEYLNTLKESAWNGFVIGLIMKGGQDITSPQIREQYKEEIYTAVDKSNLPENVKQTVKEVMITPAQAQINQDLQNYRNNSQVSQYVPQNGMKNNLPNYQQIKGMELIKPNPRVLALPEGGRIYVNKDGVAIDSSNYVAPGSKSVFDNNYSVVNGRQVLSNPQNQAQTQNIQQSNATLPTQAEMAQNANMAQITQKPNLPTQRAQETLQSAKLAGMTDMDIQKAKELNDMLRSGTRLNFYDEKTIPQNVQADKAKIANGFYRDGTLWINKNSKNKVEQILGHELTHHLETTDSYADLSNTILDSEVFYDFVAEKGYTNVAEYKTKLKEMGYADAQLDNELVARFVEEKMFTDQKSIDRLARQNTKLVEKIKNWISDLVVSFKGTSQEKELRKIENMYRKALDQARNSTASTETQYSVGGVIGARNIQNNPEYRNIMTDYREANVMLKNGMKNSETIRKTGWFKDTDGNIKYEFSDEDMALKESYKFETNKIYPLDNILKHDILFEAYPQLRDYTVVSMNLGDKHRAAIFGPMKVILLNNQLLKTKGQVEYSLIHEIQHAIQNIEGFPGARTNINGKYAYYTSLGEIESRDTSNRLRMLAEERRMNIPETAKENPTHPGLENYLKNRKEADIEKDNKYIAKKERTDALKESVKKFIEGRMGFDDFEESDNSNIYKTTSEDDKLSSRTDGRGRLAGKEPAFSMPEKAYVTDAQKRYVNKIGNIQYNLNDDGTYYLYIENKNGDLEYTGNRTKEKVLDMLGIEVGNEIVDNATSETKIMRDIPTYPYVMTQEEVDRAVSKAKKSFKTTKDFREVGYLTVDGAMLDFSDKRNGGPAGTRNNDHREIDVIGYNMNEFINMGNIRMKPESHGFELSTMPTESQEKALKKYIDYFDGDMYVDIAERGNAGKTVDYLKYNRGTSSDKILSDIKYYFKTGRKPYVSQLDDFRYSMNPVEVAKNPKAQESNLLNEIAPIDEKQLENVEEKETTASILTKSPKRPAKDLLKQSVDVVMRKLVDAGNTINTVGKLTGDKHLYEYFNNTKQARQSAEYMIGEAQTDIKGNRVGNSLIRIFEEVRSKGDAYTNEFFEYLLHMHNIDRMAQNKPVFGASVTAEDSRKIANQLLEKHPEFEKQANKVYAYNRNLMQWRVDSGLISKEQADLMNEMYPHYVPTFRDVSGTSGSRAMQGTVQIANTVRKATGSNKDIMPIDASMARQTMQTVQAAKRNLLGNRLLNDALNNKDKVGEYIQAVEKTTEQNDLETELDTPKDTNLDSNNNVFKIFRNGETYVMQVNNGIYEGLKSISSEIDNTDTKLLLKPVKAANNMFKKLITGYSPMFTIKNFARDIQDAGLYSKNLRGFLKKYPKAYQEMMGNGKMWQLYKSLGGTGSSFFDYETGIEKTLDTQNKTSTKIKDATLGKVEELNMMIEQAPRFAEFMATIEKAGNQNYDTLMEAMLNAADITVNFGRSGTWGKALNSTAVPFFNPSIQGFDKYARTVLESKDGKKAAKLILRASLLGILPSVLNELLYSDDDEYENLTDRDKDTNFLIKTGDNKWIKIPKGRVLSIFGNTATRLMRSAKGEEWDFGEYAKNQASQTAPISVFDSNLYSPIQAVQNNKTWYGSDIVPQRLQDYAPKDQYDENTDAFSKWLGGKINYSPKKINYLIDAYTGVIGDVVLPLTTPKAETNPFTKAFVLDGVTSNEISNDFYNMLDKYNPKQNPKKSAKEVSRYLNKQSSQVSDIYKQIREVENSDISDDEKRKQVRELRELANTIELTAMATVPEYEKAVEKYRGTFADEDVDSDYAYLFANRDIFGAEYAVKTFSKSLYNNHKNENMDKFFRSYFTKQYFQKKLEPEKTKTTTKNTLPTLSQQRAKLPTLKK